MRTFAVISLLLLVLCAGCASEKYSFFNGSHFAKHFTCIYDDLHDFHRDVDHVIFGIWEVDPNYRDPFTLKSSIID